MTSRFLHSICVQAFYTYIFFRAQAAYRARSPAAYRLPRSHIAITSFRYKAADDLRAWLVISGTYAVYPISAQGYLMRMTVVDRALSGDRSDNAAASPLCFLSPKV